MRSYTHFTLNERKYLQELLAEGKSIRKIADHLGRSPSSVSREISRNNSKTPLKASDNKYNYHSWRANSLTVARRRKNKPRAIVKDSPEWDFIIDALNRYWSPETICGKWHSTFPERKPLSISTIYRYIKKKRFPGIRRETHLRRRGKRHYNRNSNYNTIHPDRLIPEWPEEIKNRQRIGDWEGDTVYGGVGKGLLVSMVDRKSRFLCVGKLSSRNATETRNKITEMMAGLPVNSISLDNGAEFSEFRELEKTLNTTIYFAEPHKPWQRGSNENTNDILRFFYPKGFDFHTLDDEALQQVVNLINNRPRKCLNWKSPYEVFFCVAID
ncbi:MAG: IS30 family transposase [Clostridia bacterium]|nr:IS30 family transposase [Clostridia bacterium]